jgi:hypothetical protein
MRLTSKDMYMVAPYISASGFIGEFVGEFQVPDA